ncbi:hypothetical protein PRZ48_003157 [Zasmidium cellare]|uniref:Amidohydrolase-related domain-containing protein n=1 Tax=Zasmidium cellare TaxID=395010 RepID=A0ABR0EU85_ZASCE|nr:hypothetical protein PRZ48_003157 [Zasmidium cellare]
MDSFLITDIRIFDGEQVLESGSVLVRDGTMAQVSANGPIDFNGPTISKPGHTLIPGLIDAHVHVEPGHESGLAQSLRFGVTTMCDLGNAPFQLKRLRECAEEGDCSDRFGINISKHVKPLETEDDARAYVDDRITQDVDYIKLIHESGSSYGMKLPTLSPAVEKAIVAKAHEAGLPVLAHAMTVKDTLAVLEASVDGTAHTILDRSPTAELIAAYKKNNAFCNPTLALIASATEEGRQMQERYAHDPRARELLGQVEKDQMCQCLSLAKDAGGKLEHAVETVKALKAAGIDILW